MKINLVVLPNHPPFIPSLGLERIKAKLASTNPKVEVRVLYLNIMMEKYFRPMNSLITVLFQHFLKNNSSKNLLDTLDEIMSVPLKSPHAPIRKFYEVRMKPLHDSLRHMIIKNDKRISALDRYCTVLINQTALMDCKIVGFTSVFTPLEPIIFFCRKLKTMNPSIKTVIGGSLVYKEIDREWIRKEPNVDYVVSGPALKSFPLLVSAIAEKNSKESNSIPGVFTKINYNNITDRGEDIPLEDYPVLNYNAYVTAYNKYNRANKLRPRLLLEISRGCKWGRCNFCNHYAYDERYDYSDEGSELLQLNNILAKYPNADIQLSDAFVTPRVLRCMMTILDLSKIRVYIFMMSLIRKKNPPINERQFLRKNCYMK